MKERKEESDSQGTSDVQSTWITPDPHYNNGSETPGDDPDDAASFGRGIGAIIGRHKRTIILVCAGIALLFFVRFMIGRCKRCCGK